MTCTESNARIREDGEHMLVMQLPQELHAQLRREASEKSIPIDEIVRMELRARYGQWSGCGAISITAGEQG